VQEVDILAERGRGPFVVAIEEFIVKLNRYPEPGSGTV
jgi:hypothetical protein